MLTSKGPFYGVPCGFVSGCTGYLFTVSFGPSHWMFYMNTPKQPRGDDGSDDGASTTGSG